MAALSPPAASEELPTPLAELLERLRGAGQQLDAAEVDLATLTLTSTLTLALTPNPNPNPNPNPDPDPDPNAAGGTPRRQSSVHRSASPPGLGNPTAGQPKPALPAAAASSYAAPANYGALAHSHAAASAAAAAAAAAPNAAATPNAHFRQPVPPAASGVAALHRAAPVAPGPISGSPMPGMKPLPPALPPVGASAIQPPADLYRR